MADFDKFSAPRWRGHRPAVVLRTTTPEWKLLYPATNQGMQTKVQRVQVRTGDSGTAEVTAVGVPVARLLNDLRGAAVDYPREGWYSVIAGRVPLVKHPTLLGR